MTWPHVVIDARPIETSTGRYMQRLVEQLNDLSLSDISYTVLVPTAHVEKWTQRLKRMNVVAADQKWYSFAEQWSLYKQLRELKPDLVHFTMPQQPLLWRGRSVTTIHDTTLLRHSTNRGGNPLKYALRKYIFTALLKAVIKRSEQIITPTEYVKQDLIKFAGKKYQDKFTVTLEAGEPSEDKPFAVPILQNKQYLFYIGNAFPYKNLERILRAYAKLKLTHPQLELVFAGRPDYFYEQLKTLSKQLEVSNVHFLGFVSDGEKRWLFKNASAYIVASLSEGFHIPGLEAMYEHCPVISADATCLPEVLGDAALYFDPLSTDSLVQTVNSLLDNTSLRAELITKGDQRVGQFSWKKMAEQTNAVYKSVFDKKT